MHSTRRVLATVVAAAWVLAGCSTASPPQAGSPTASRVIQVVAAENFWGSIAAQLGGKQVRVRSIIDSPDAATCS